jgi:hypothetical protein
VVAVVVLAELAQHQDPPKLALVARVLRFHGFQQQLEGRWA